MSTLSLQPKGSGTVASSVSRPSSAASYNSWVRENPDYAPNMKETKKSSTAVQHLLSPGSTSSLHDDASQNGKEGESPPRSTSRTSRPTTPSTMRATSPKPSRPVSPSMSHILKNNAVVPTDEVLPKQEPVKDKPAPIEAWPEAETGDQHITEEPVENRPASRTRSPGEGSHTGSGPSMHSVISVKEAADDRRVDGMSLSGRLTPSTGRQDQRSTSGEKKNDDTRSLVSRSSTQIVPPQMAKQQQAYIPYIMARDTISKVVDDMKAMKSKHIDIVQKIQEANTKIENETQYQFKVFVAGLRGQYKEKVKTFKQVIYLHQQELEKMKSHWQATLASLNEKNRELMKQKQELLVMNKTEVEKLQKEKEDLMTELTQKLDEEEKSNSRMTLKLKETEDSFEAERKILKDQLTQEENTIKAKDDEIAQLRGQLQEGGFVPLVITPGTDSDIKGVSEDDHVAPVTAVAATTAVVGAAEVNRLKVENERIQDGMIEVQKELAVLQMKHANLEKQYRSVVLMAQKDGESIAAQQESINRDMDLLEEEKRKLQAEIIAWENGFRGRTGQEPTEDDRTESIKELHVQLNKVDTQVAGLQAQLATLDNLREGKVPEPEPIVVPEPIIRTVEVTIPDPNIAAELESSKASSRQLQSDLDDLRGELDEARRSVKRLEKENAVLQNKESTPADNANAVLVLQAMLKQMTEQDDSGHAESREELEVRLGRIRDEKQQLEEKQQEIKGNIDSWCREFEEANGRAPESEDRSEEIDSLYQSLKENNEKGISLEAEIMALDMMVTGNMPVDFQQVTTAQVLLDAKTSPEDVRELQEWVEALEGEIEEFRDQNTALERSLKEKREENKSLEEQLNQSDGRKEAVTLTGEMDFSSYDDYDEDDMEGIGAQMNTLRRQQDDLQRKLDDERDAHARTREELENTRDELEQARQEGAAMAEDSEGKEKAASAALLAQIALQEKSLDEAKQRIDELEKEKLSDVPADTAKEIERLQDKLKKSEKEKDEHQKAVIQKTSDVDKLKVEIETTQKSLAKEREANRGHQDNLKKKLAEKDKQAKEMVSNAEKKYTARDEERQQQIKALEKKLKEAKLTGAAGGATAAKGANKVDAKTERKITMMQDHINNLKKQVETEKNTVKQLEKDLREAKSDGAADKQAGKKIEKQLKDLEKKLESETKKFEREQKKATELDTQLKEVTKERDVHADEIKKLELQIESLGVAAKEALELKEQCDAMKGELKDLRTENKSLAENFNSERILRKKYYNMVEDMKGKIRVYCRARPLSSSEKERGNFEILKAPDEYSIEIESGRGNKEFQFDHIFMPGTSQEEVFEDTNNLIQSAVDGYNVCIFAYGQTGSGKTFTMIGDRDQNFPGIAPRAFQKIFDVIEENKSKFSFKVYTYMCELYNDRLIDLYSKAHSEEQRLDIKKDKKGMVFIQGAVVQEATDSKELYGLFEQGSENRHVASTKMNAESSRSHLILAIIIESTNLSTGSVTKGKLSLVDLAGSERAAKTGATAEQLREANSINKSLSALGDVISALSSEQQFIPYRNNKLTMLMQDSLGGNAKTLMFVNISPADYNAEETVISLTYASRVKLITNDASKNADNKEIARLKNIIAKLKKGESLDEEEEGED